MFLNLWKNAFGPNLWFFADGDGGDGGGGGGELTWHGDYQYFTDNPDAVKAFSKYADESEAFKGAHEAIKKLGEPYRLPKNFDKLSDEQKAEFNTSLAKLKGVPENAEGYEFKVPDGVSLDEQTLADFKLLCHKQGKTTAEAQEILDLQLGMVGRLNEERDTAIKEMTDSNYKQFVKECGGEKQALLRMGWIKEFLQSKCTTEDDKGEMQPDPEMWEAFAKRITYGDRVIELPLLRALSDAAQQARGQGGSPAGAGAGPMAAGALDYPEMK